MTVDPHLIKTEISRGGKGARFVFFFSRRVTDVIDDLTDDELCFRWQWQRSRASGSRPISVGKCLTLIGYVIVTKKRDCKNDSLWLGMAFALRRFFKFNDTLGCLEYFPGLDLICLSPRY